MLNWKKKYFGNKVRGVESMILDLEFKRFKTQEIREEVRVEYDNLKNKLALLETQIKQQKENPTMEKGDIARLDDQKVLIERDMERFLNQIKSLDLEVNGSKPTNDYPDGVSGITQQLESLRELKDMLKECIKQGLWKNW